MAGDHRIGIDRRTLRGETAALPLIRLLMSVLLPKVFGMSGITDHILISLPIEDRRRSMEFYRDVFGFELIGEPAEDGVPEPLQFRLNDRTALMLIPTGGFGWVQPGREVATSGVTECLIGVAATDEQTLTELVERVRAAGGDVVVEPGMQPWGFSAVATDLDGHAWQFSVAP